ncbi:MAG: hypothetical protein QOI80_3374, partial [Solirubrobacteraceae bacterium]|nr:hypothetical protein [Solirubrobacteraceae bacterium]
MSAGVLSAPVLRSSSPGPAATAAFVVLALVASIVILVVRERSYERDPQLRARAGLVDAGSDISLMRSANFGRVLDAITKRLRPGGTMRGLSVTPSEVSATLLTGSGAETFVTVTPGLHVEARRSGNRLSDRSGVLPAAIAPDGPARILSSAQRRFGLRPGEFERLTLDVG